MSNLVVGLLAGLISGIGTAGSAYLGLTAQGWTFADDLISALLPYFIGGLGAGFLSALASRMFFGNAAFSRRFALVLSLHALLALGITAGIFALQYRIYFSQWHSPILTITWMFQTFFTTLGSLYLFLSTGLVLLVPWALIIWISISVYLARPLNALGLEPSLSSSS